MPRSSHLKCYVWGMVCFAGLSSVTTPGPTWAQAVVRTSVHVVVTEADTGKPINQARLTLRFREPGSKTKLKLPKMTSYSAKTNSQGRYKFTDIPKGTILLLVTADRHQSFGKEIELEEDNQVVEVKLRKPQPLL